MFVAKVQETLTDLLII